MIDQKCGVTPLRVAQTLYCKRCGKAYGRGPWLAAHSKDHYCGWLCWLLGTYPEDRVLALLGKGGAS